MRDTRFLINRNTGKFITTGYTIRAYNYSTDTSVSNYTGSPIVTYTSDDYGAHYADITATTKVTLVILDSDGSPLTVRDNMKGIILQGDNQPTIMPGSTS